MSVAGWMEEKYDDAVIWKALADGELKGIEFDKEDDYDQKKIFLSYAARMKPRSIKDIAVLLALSSLHWQLSDDSIAETIISAFCNKEQTGLFPELKETYGYPVFNDQFVKVLVERAAMCEREAFELADGMSKKKWWATKLFDTLLRKSMDDEQVEFLWLHIPGSCGRKMYTHHAKLIYEAGWIIYNSCFDDRYLNDPVRIRLFSSK